MSADMVNGVTKILAEVPLAETFGYSTDLRSMTQGQGTFTMELAKYRPVPASIQAEVIAGQKAKLQQAGEPRRHRPERQTGRAILARSRASQRPPVGAIGMSV